MRTLTVEADFGSQTTSGRVFVELEIAEHVSKLGIPQTLKDEALSTISVSGGGMRKIHVPVTSAAVKGSDFDGLTSGGPSCRQRGGNGDRNAAAHLLSVPGGGHT